MLKFLGYYKQNGTKWNKNVSEGVNEQILGTLKFSANPFSSFIIKKKIAYRLILTNRY